MRGGRHLSGSALAVADLWKYRVTGSSRRQTARSNTDFARASHPRKFIPTLLVFTKQGFVPGTKRETIMKSPKQQENVGQGPSSIKPLCRFTWDAGRQAFRLGFLTLFQPQSAASCRLQYNSQRSLACGKPTTYE